MLIELAGLLFICIGLILILIALVYMVGGVIKKDWTVFRIGLFISLITVIYFLFFCESYLIDFQCFASVCWLTRNPQAKQRTEQVDS